MWEDATVSFGTSEQVRRLVEVTALSALMASKPSKRVEWKLKQYAFPEEIQLDG